MALYRVNFDGGSSPLLDWPDQGWPAFDRYAESELSPTIVLSTSFGSLVSSRFEIDMNLMHRDQQIENIGDTVNPVRTILRWYPNLISPPATQQNQLN